MKFRSCFNIFEVDEPLEQALPTDDIDFIDEEVDVIVDEEIEQENEYVFNLANNRVYVNRNIS